MGRKLEMIDGLAQRVEQVTPTQPMESYHLNPLSPEQIYKMIHRATEELDRYEVYLATHPEEEPVTYLKVIEGEA